MEIFGLLCRLRLNEFYIINSNSEGGVIHFTTNAILPSKFITNKILCTHAPLASSFLFLLAVNYIVTSEKTLVVKVHQWFSIRGPRAKNGPRSCFEWPAGIPLNYFLSVTNNYLFPKFLLAPHPPCSKAVHRKEKSVKSLRLHLPPSGSQSLHGKER